MKPERCFMFIGAIMIVLAVLTLSKRIKELTRKLDTVTVVTYTLKDEEASK